MIKKKVVFNIISYGTGDVLAQHMTIAALDGYCLTSPVVKSRFSITAVMAKDVKVTKLVLNEMIVNDFKVEVGSVPIKGPTTILHITH